MLPFSTQEVPATIKGAIEAAQAGDLVKMGGAGVTIGGEIVGAKSSPVTLLERLHAASANPKASEAAYNAYFDIPSNETERKAKLADATTPEERKRYSLSRDAYRVANPTMDAELFLAGGFESMQSGAAYEIALRMMQETGLSIEDVEGLKEEDYPGPARLKRRRWFQVRLGQAVAAAPGSTGVGVNEPGPGPIEPNYRWEEPTPVGAGR